MSTVLTIRVLSVVFMVYECGMLAFCMIVPGIQQPVTCLHMYTESFGFNSFRVQVPLLLYFLCISCFFVICSLTWLGWIIF